MSNLQVQPPAGVQIKIIRIRDVIHLLKNGYTRWARDKEATGAWGSIQEYYNLSNGEAMELFAHEKLRNIKTKIPTMIIIEDDSEDVVTLGSEVTPENSVSETSIEATLVEALAQETPDTIQGGTPVAQEVNNDTEVITEELLPADGIDLQEEELVFS